MNYNRQIATAKRLIEKYGQTVSFSRISETISDPLKPWEKTLGTPEVSNFKMVFIDPNATGISQLGKEFLQYLKGSEILEGKLRGLLANNNFEPKPTDILTRNSKELKIYAINPLAPSDQTILYVLELEP